MAEDHIRYDVLTQEALRGVVRKVLSEVAKTGLPGEHHFFISFITRAPGVRISEKLLAQYDKEMTIVLQNQYWDLKVTDTAFEVGLSFDNQPEMLMIPFAAIKGFFDPSVEFGLQIDVDALPEADTGEDDQSTGDENPEGEVRLEVVDDGKTEGDKPEGEGADKVVSLDSFRKKP